MSNGWHLCNIKIFRAHTHFWNAPWFGAAAGMAWRQGVGVAWVGVGVAWVGVGVAWVGAGVAWVGAGEVGAGLDRGRSGPKALFNTLS